MVGCSYWIPSSDALPRLGLEIRGGVWISTKLQNAVTSRNVGVGLPGSSPVLGRVSTLFSDTVWRVSDSPRYAFGGSRTTDLGVHAQRIDHYANATTNSYRPFLNNNTKICCSVGELARFF